VFARVSIQCVALKKHSVLHCGAVLQCVAVCLHECLLKADCLYWGLQHGVLQYIAVCSSVSHYGAVWCSVVQHVAVRCSVLQFCA